MVLICLRSLNSIVWAGKKKVRKLPSVGKKVYISHYTMLYDCPPFTPISVKLSGKYYVDFYLLGTECLYMNSSRAPQPCTIWPSFLKCNLLWNISVTVDPFFTVQGRDQRLFNLIYIDYFFMLQQIDLWSS